MAGETWKSHQMTTRERDMDMDHAQQLGDVDTAAAIHDEWMFGDDETVWGDEDPAFRLTIANYPGGMTLVTHLSPAGIVEALAAGAAVIVDPTEDDIQRCFRRTPTNMDPALPAF